MLHPAAAWQKKNHSHLSNSRLRDSFYLQALKQLQFISATLGLLSFFIYIYLPKATFSFLQSWLIMMSIHPFSITALSCTQGRGGAGADPSCLEAAAGWHPWKVSTSLQGQREANNRSYLLSQLSSIWRCQCAKKMKPFFFTIFDPTISFFTLFGQGRN